MPKYFATIICVIDAEDDETAWNVADRIAEDLDVEQAWVDSIEETEEFKDEEIEEEE